MSTRRASREANRYDVNSNGDKETVFRESSFVATKPSVGRTAQSRKIKACKQNKSASSSVVDLHQSIAASQAESDGFTKTNSCTKRSPRSSSMHADLETAALNCEVKPQITQIEDIKVSGSQAIVNESKGQEVKARESWEGVFRKPIAPTAKSANGRSQKGVKKTSKTGKAKSSSSDNLLQMEIVIKATNHAEGGVKAKEFSSGTAVETLVSEKPEDFSKAGANKPAMTTSTAIESKGTGKESTQRKTQRGGARRSKGAASTRRSVKVNESALKGVPNAGQDSSLNRQITDFFQVVRRSDRRTAKQLDDDRREELEFLVEDFQSRESSCFKVVNFADKGRGVVTATNFQRGDFVVEYAGELIDENEARRREEMYSRDDSIGCYVYYFMAGARRCCIDATRETGRIGRLINHSRKEANLVTRCVNVPFGYSGSPRLLFFAKRDIGVGEELLYDYGDRSRSVLESHPWLKV